MEEKINRVLESIGLNKNEIKIYLDLIKYQNSSALDISKRTKIHRSNTYDAIRKLIERGFISEIIEDRKRLFKAMNPEKIKDYVTQQQNEVDLIIPYLKNVSCDSKSNDCVTISKGVFSVRESLHDLLKLKKPIYVLGASREALDSLGMGFLKEFHDERIKDKIMMSHIYNQNALERIAKLNKMKYTEARCFPNKFCSIVSTNVCDDTVLLLVFSNPITSITIKNKELADSYVNYYQMLWKQSKSSDKLS